jgi:hypothetical protein
VQYGEESKKRQDGKAPLYKAALNQEGTRKFEEAQDWEIGCRKSGTRALTAMAAIKIKQKSRSDLSLAATGWALA